jgi:hypothetical protein
MVTGCFSHLSCTSPGEALGLVRSFDFVVSIHTKYTYDGTKEMADISNGSDPRRTVVGNQGSGSS